MSPSGWNGGPEWWNGGPAKWNGGPKWVERRTSRVERRTNRVEQRTSRVERRTSRVERRTSGAVEQQTPLNLLCDGLSATTPHTSSSRHDYMYASPSKVKALGWLEGRVNAGTDTRGVNHAVPVVECATVLTSYWCRKG